MLTPVDRNVAEVQPDDPVIGCQRLRHHSVEDARFCPFVASGATLGQGAVTIRPGDTAQDHPARSTAARAARSNGQALEVAVVTRGGHSDTTRAKQDEYER